MNCHKKGVEVTLEGQTFLVQGKNQIVVVEEDGIHEINETVVLVLHLWGLSKRKTDTGRRIDV